jgi:hypothetical protein
MSRAACGRVEGWKRGSVEAEESGQLPIVGSQLPTASLRPCVSARDEIFFRVFRVFRGWQVRGS